MTALTLPFMLRHLVACVVALALAASPFALHAAPAPRSFVPPDAMALPIPQKIGLRLDHCKPASEPGRTVCAVHCLDWNVNEPQARPDDPRTAKKVPLAPPQSLIACLAVPVEPRRAANRWKPGDHARTPPERVYALTSRYRL